MSVKSSVNLKYLKGSVLTGLLSLLLFIGIIFVFLTYSKVKCHEPVQFSIGNVDSQFKINDKAVRDIAEDAANRWNGQTGQKVLAYNPNAKLKINLVYDQRQKDFDDITALSNKSADDKTIIEKSNKELKSLITMYETDLKSYNERVAFYNNNGGAPEDVYNYFNQEKSNLDKRKVEIQALAKKLNIRIDDFNQEISNLNQVIDSQRNEIVTQGLYIPSRDVIEIYTFGTEKELRLVLMHELGHALGLDHTKYEKSIMYYLLANQNLDDPTITTEDLGEMSDRCSMKKSYLYSWFLNFSPSKR